MTKPSSATEATLLEQRLENIQIPGLKLVREIGRGGSSVVYLAEKQIEDGKVESYAVKILKSGSEKDRPLRLRRLRREAGVLSRIQHPCLVKILEVGEIR